MAQEPRIIGQVSNHGHDDGAAPAVTAGPLVGDELRQIRESMGLGIREIADTLRIRREYIEALEESRIEDLPGTTYAIGFVRSYANLLGLDGEKAAQRFKDEVAHSEVPAELAFPEPATESRIPRGAVVLVSVVLAASAYGGWYYLSSRDLAVGDLVPTVPENLAEETETAEAPATLPEASAPRGVPDPDAQARSASPLASPTAPAPESSPPAASGDTGAESGRTATVPEARSMPDMPAPARPETGSEPPPEAATEISEAPAETTTGAPPLPEGAGETVTGPEPDEATAGTEVPTGEHRAAPRPPERPVARALPPAPPEAPAERSAPAAESAAETEPAVPAPESGAASEAQTARTDGPSETGAPQTAAPASAVVIRAKSDSWIQVRGGDGQLLVTRILRAGDSFTVPDGEGLRLMTGNAGALEILVDGEPVPPIGPFGAVRRDVALDAERMRAGTAADR